MGSSIRMKILFLVSAIAATVTPKVQEASGATGFRVVCPPALPANTASVRKSQDGWTVSKSGNQPFNGSGMLHGDPDEEAYLVPDSVVGPKAGKSSHATRRWTFGVPHGHEKWIYCAYGTVQLARRIPAHASECTATESLDRGSYGPTVFRCK
jgi:hypothetical protein